MISLSLITLLKQLPPSFPLNAGRLMLHCRIKVRYRVVLRRHKNVDCHGELPSLIAIIFLLFQLSCVERKL